MDSLFGFFCFFWGRGTITDFILLFNDIFLGVFWDHVLFLDVRECCLVECRHFVLFVCHWKGKLSFAFFIFESLFYFLKFHSFELFTSHFLLFLIVQLFCLQSRFIQFNNSCQSKNLHHSHSSGSCSWGFWIPYDHVQLFRRASVIGIEQIGQKRDIENDRKGRKHVQEKEKRPRVSRYRQAHHNFSHKNDDESNVEPIDDAIRRSFHKNYPEVLHEQRSHCQNGDKNLETEAKDISYLFTFRLLSGVYWSWGYFLVREACQKMRRWFNMQLPLKPRDHGCWKLSS